MNRRDFKGIAAAFAAAATVDLSTLALNPVTVPDRTASSTKWERS